MQGLLMAEKLCSLRKIAISHKIDIWLRMSVSLFCTGLYMISNLRNVTFIIFQNKNKSIGHNFNYLILNIKALNAKWAEI